MRIKLFKYINYTKAKVCDTWWLKYPYSTEICRHDSSTARKDMRIVKVVSC